MGEQESQDNEEQTFNLELTASEAYSLQTLLNYMTVDMDRRYAVTAEILSKTVNEEIASESFNSAIENEMTEFKEQFESHDAAPIPDLQSKTFQ